MLLKVERYRNPGLHRHNLNPFVVFTVFPLALLKMVLENSVPPPRYAEWRSTVKFFRMIIDPKVNARKYFI